MKEKEKAAALGVTPRQYCNLKKQEGFPVDGTIEEIQEWHENKRITRNSSLDDVRDLKAKLTEEQGRLTKVKRKLAELELEKEREGLVPLSEAKRIIHETLAPLRTLLDALPARLAHSANPSDPALAQEAITDGLNSVFELIAKSSTDEGA